MEYIAIRKCYFKDVLWEEGQQVSFSESDNVASVNFRPVDEVVQEEPSRTEAVVVEVVEVPVPEPEVASETKLEAKKPKSKRRRKPTRK